MPGYSPTVTGHFCNSLRSVFEPYIREMKPHLKGREHFPPTVKFLPIIARPLAVARERARCASCCWEVQYVFPNTASTRFDRQGQGLRVLVVQGKEEEWEQRIQMVDA
jgi:hypothetical protein